MLILNDNINKINYIFFSLIWIYYFENGDIESNNLLNNNAYEKIY